MAIFSSSQWRSVMVFIAVVAASVAPPTPGFASNWFWKKVPAHIEEGSRANAMLIVARARSGERSLFLATSHARRIMARWRGEIESAAGAARINEALITAVVMVESNGDPNAKSPKGAIGLGQLMPETARRYGVRNARNPRENLRAAATYLSHLMDMFRGDLVLALAAYNSGEGTVLRYRGVPPYPETRAYIPKVLGAFEAAGRLCLQPPRAARRRCRLPNELE